ncbi:unnamed protein product [Thelazia callipaeda]|uniref:DNA repair protein REV1 n=1 Tax=Thelazia callipaeda TaxID=103827 RepID=A0A0N5D103_THECL|nr:unnamed protein product [Thelazia callipaeda]
MYESGEKISDEREESHADLWRNYMQSKKAKLEHQVNVLDKCNTVSDIFKGISIFVNGYTDPSAAELRRLIHLHGGQYHIYYLHGRTTYTVATHLAAGKINKLRKDEKVIHPKWITDSIDAGIRLHESKYLLYESGTKKLAVNYGASTSKAAQSAANDPNFVNHFYERSRLHLISTLAQEMKLYINELRENGISDFSSRGNLLHLVDENFVEPPKETICHIDLDCFFVSVALRNRMDLIGKPVAITHSKDTEGPGMSEIASCSYEARARGVRNGSFIKDARKVCPDLICLPYQFEEYRRISKEIYTIISRYTLHIHAVSCDEMYVDLKNLCADMHISNIMQIVSLIRRDILTTTQCNASVGVGNTMLMARIATRHAKPNNQFVIRCSDVNEFIRREEILSLPGIGYNVAFGRIKTCGDLQKLSIDQLQNLLGDKTGTQIYNMCRGIDKQRDFLEKVVRKSVSCDINYGIRFTQEIELEEFLGKMCSELERKLDLARLTASTISLKFLIRSPDAPIKTEKYLGCGKCDAVTKSIHLSDATANRAVLFAEVKKLMKTIKLVISDLRGVIFSSYFINKLRIEIWILNRMIKTEKDNSKIELYILQIGIQLTHLKEMPKESVKKQHTFTNTLTQFFAVKSKGEHCAGLKRKSMDEEEAALKEAVKKSLKEFKYASRYKKETIHPDYRNYFEDADVKAEFLQVMNKSLYPNREQVSEIAAYFSLLVRNGDLSDMLSQIRFLERETAKLSLEWIVVVSALKIAINHICRDKYGSVMFF